ncbi:MAG: hypothetical protein MJZ18_06735 [Bacteroidales bacterium]|nr:hypothetical protein [Bacteroidales bacterium]
MKTVGLIGKVIMFAIVVIALALAVLMGANNEILAEQINPAASADGSFTGIIIVTTIAILAIGVLGAIFSWVFEAFTNPEGLLKSAIIVVACFAIVAICWYLADDTILNLPGYEGTDNEPFMLKVADTGIFLAYISASAAVLCIIYSEVRQLFR